VTDEEHLQAIFCRSDRQGWREGARAAQAEEGPNPQAVPRKGLKAVPDPTAADHDLKTLDLRKRWSMTVWKRLKRLWILLTTEEVFDEQGSLGRRTVVRRAPRA
jgi:hypothetical protein